MGNNSVARAKYLQRALWMSRRALYQVKRALSSSDLLNACDHHFGLPLLLPCWSLVFCPGCSRGCVPFFLCTWVAFWGCSFWCLFFFRGCSFSFCCLPFLWRGRWCLFFLWWGSCVFFLCSSCWG